MPSTLALSVFCATACMDYISIFAAKQPLIRACARGNPTTYRNAPAQIAQSKIIAKDLIRPAIHQKYSNLTAHHLRLYRGDRSQSNSAFQHKGIHMR